MTSQAETYMMHIHVSITYIQLIHCQNVVQILIVKNQGKCYIHARWM